MSRTTILILVACVTAVPLEAVADTWCNSSYPPDPPSCHCDAIWCQDLDRICNGAPPCPPTPPMPCPFPCGGDLCWSWAAIRGVFPRTSSTNDGSTLCGVEFKGEEDEKLLSSAPFGTRFPYGQLGQATVDLTGDIQYTFGPEFNAVVGTDVSPLVLRFDVSGGLKANFHGPNDIGYMELFLDTGQPNKNRAPMDHILVGGDNGQGCIDCYHMCEAPNYSVPVPWPFVCQSYEVRTEAPFCPPAQTNVRTAIAVGYNALLDINPCHCETPENQKPRNPYLSFYDGLKWRILHPDHPGPQDEAARWETTYPGKYFVLGAKINRVTMTIMKDTVDIELYAKQTPVEPGVWAEVTSKVYGIKREYLGEFNKLHAGAAIGCEMDSSGNCVGNRKCMSLGYDRCDGLGKIFDGHKWLVFDGIAIAHGAPFVQEGACCLPGDSCDVMLPEACDTAGGAFAGPSTTCEESTCIGACCLPGGDCVSTPYDACTGTFKGPGSDCATAYCPCSTPFADADGDGDADQSDFAVLQACFTGQGGGPLESSVCRCFDRDNSGEGDGDIDMDDVIAFENCASGPVIPASPACGG